MSYLDAVLGRVVDPTTQEIFKFLPSNPPRRGEVVLVDGVRVRVTRAKIDWDGREWSIRVLRVKAAPK